jgi:glycosyltransferase involved in cell wall biosynthesis
VELAARMTSMSADSSRAPAVSVLLTSYNRERYIAEAIESVLCQSFEDFELVISDNRSTDRTLEIVQDYAKRDPRIRVSLNESNIGQFGNRRKAASLARGRFLKYHDSDDVMTAGTRPNHANQSSCGTVLNASGGVTGETVIPASPPKTFE